MQLIQKHDAQLTKLTTDATQATRNKPADSTDLARVIYFIPVLGKGPFL